MTTEQNPPKTDFGFEQVSPDEKTEKVAQVFHSVADKYDIMNDLMSLGVHRLWKRQAIAKLQLREGMQVLDLAAGSGDLTRLISPKVGESGQVVMSDINDSMLKVGRDRLLNRGIWQNINIVQANAEQLPFADNHFDRVIIGFGLRNVTDKAKALKEMYRVLKPGGFALVLEFTKPVIPALAKVYDWYSFNLLPKVGKWVAKDEDSYRYLAESIRMHPDQVTLKEMMQQAGFEDSNFQNLSAGIVAIHQGFKY